MIFLRLCLEQAIRKIMTDRNLKAPLLSNLKMVHLPKFEMTKDKEIIPEKNQNLALPWKTSKLKLKKVEPTNLIASFATQAIIPCSFALNIPVIMLEPIDVMSSTLCALCSSSKHMSKDCFGKDNRLSYECKICISKGHISAL